MEREGRLHQERAARRELTTTFPGQPQQQNQRHYHHQDVTNSGQREEHGQDSGLYASGGMGKSTDSGQVNNLNTAGPPSIPLHAQGPQVLSSTAFKHENSQPLPDPTLSPALGGANSNPFPSQRPRACDSCRGLKVRCQPTDESNPFGTCKRCAKARRTCIFTPPSRKRQKKTDTRVDELERKIEALTASLHAGVNARVNDVQSPTPSSADEDDEGEEKTNEGGSRAAVEVRGSSESRGLSVGGLGEGGTVSSPKIRNISKKRSREDHDDNYNDDVDDDGGIDNIKDSPPSNPVMQPNKIAKPIISTSTETMENKPPEQGGTQAEHGEERSRGDGDDYRDVVDRGLLNMDLATEIFNRYVNEMVPLFPAVVFPPGTTAKEVRRTKPTVFLAILAIASGTAGEALHTKLNQEIVEILAERVLCKGEKSLGLIQSLVLCSAWYYPPAEKEELRFYQLVHMAAVMTMDIGINRRNGHLRKQAGGFGSMDTRTVPSTAPGTVWREHTVRNETRQFPDSSAIESRRTLLGAYYCCSAVAMGLRRQNIFRFTTYMGECVEVLETSEDALPSDRVLAQWCKVQKIAEEISVAFLFDDPGANVSIQDLSVQFALRGFSRQLEQFNQVYLKDGKFFKEGEGMERSLKLAYYTTALNAHEIALHVNHNVDEFGPPYTEKMLRGPSIAQNSLLTSLHIDLLSRCLTSAYAFLDIFLSFSVEELRGMPVFHFVRGIYAAVILMKLFFSASAPMSELGEVLDKDSLRVDFYVTRLVRKLEEAASGGKSRSAEKFSRVFRLLQSWWEAQRVGIGSGKGEATAADVVEETSKGAGKSYNAGNIVRHTGRSPHTGLADGNGVGRHSSEAPHTPDTTASPVRLPPLQLASGGLSNEIPSTPPYTSSSAPTPSTESGGNDRANTPIPSAASIRQRQLLPSLPPPSSFTPNTPLQILSDVASSTRGNGVQMAGREVCMPSPTMVGSSRIHHHQHHLSMQSSPGLHNIPSQNVHQPIYAYPPQPQTAQTGMHGLPHLQGQQNGYFLMTPGAMSVENQHIEGMFTGAISGGYHFATSAATRAGYISSGTLGDRREGGGSSGAGYYAQGGIGEGRGVGEVTGGNWTADDFFWSVMDGLPGSLDSGWGGGIAGGGAGASGGTSGGVG